MPYDDVPILRLNGVSSYQVIQPKDTLAVLIMAFRIGNPNLYCTYYNISNHSFTDVSVNVTDAHLYDAFKCKFTSASNSILQCLFVGRSILLQNFTIGSMVLNKTGTAEGYEPYKNVKPTQVDFSDYHVAIAGTRNNASGSKQGTVDDTGGLFVYNRLNKPGGSTFVRQLLPTAYILGMLNSSTFKFGLENRTLALHGGHSKGVYLFEIGEYRLEGKTLSQDQLKNMNFKVTGANEVVDFPIWKLTHSKVPTTTQPPKNSMMIFVWIFLSLIMLAILTVLGYILYSSYLKRKVNYRDEMDPEDLAKSILARDLDSSRESIGRNERSSHKTDEGRSSLKK